MSDPLLAEIRASEARAWLKCPARAAFEHVNSELPLPKVGTPVGNHVGKEVHEGLPELIGCAEIGSEQYDEWLNLCDAIVSAGASAKTDEPNPIITYDRFTRSEKEKDRQVLAISRKVYGILSREPNNLDQVVSAPPSVKRTERIGDVLFSVKAKPDLVIRDKDDKVLAVNLYTGVGDPLRHWPETALTAWASMNRENEWLVNAEKIERAAVLCVPRNAPDDYYFETRSVEDMLRAAESILRFISSMFGDDDPMPKPSKRTCAGCKHPTCIYGDRHGIEG